VIGVGNPWREDDGAGLAVARRLRETLPAGVAVLEREGEPMGLLDAWEGGDCVWLVDAVSSGAPPGTIHRLDASAEQLPDEVFGMSTHAIGLAAAVELARVLGRLPGTLVVYGIEGASFTTADRMTGAVEAAAGRVVRAVRGEVLAALRRPCGSALGNRSSP
jgi:hydrogenase maturation protease